MRLAPFGSIYRIVCAVNGKVYIGLTRNYVSDRWYQHKKAAATGVSSALYHAMRKYGVQNFSIEAIASALSNEALPTAERILIEQHGSYGHAGYNMSKGGEHSIERRMSVEGKRRLRAARNRPDSIENNRASQRARMATADGIAHQRRMVEAARAAKPKLCASRKAYAATIDGAAQLASASRLGAVRSAELFSKPVLAEGRKFASVREAAETYGIERGAVRFRIKSPSFDWAWAA